jgi:hypothetical protein
MELGRRRRWCGWRRGRPQRGSASYGVIADSAAKFCSSDGGRLISLAQLRSERSAVLYRADHSRCPYACARRPTRSAGRPARAAWAVLRLPTDVAVSFSRLRFGANAGAIGGRRRRWCGWRRGRPQRGSAFLTATGAQCGVNPNAKSSYELDADHPYISLATPRKERG